MPKFPRIVLSLLLMAAVAAVLLVAGPPQTVAQLKLQTFERGQLTIETAAGKRHDFEVELALTRAQQGQGLMYRRRLSEDGGMLFLYDKEWPVSMWMKNTMIPLDMLFIAKDGRIVNIAQRTVPQSLETISAERPVTAVLEVNGGTAARLGIVPGDRILHPAFGTGS